MVDNNSISVAIRVRPLNGRERGQGCTDASSAWRLEERRTITAVRRGGDKGASSSAVPAPSFTFDRVFGAESNNEDVYDNVGKGEINYIKTKLVTSSTD
eukprot:UC1_evm1s1944